MAHNGACGSAKSRTCRCAGCTGARHGWPGSLDMTAPGAREAREQARADADRTWRQASGPRGRRRSYRRLGAAVDGAKAEAIDWLAQEAADASVSDQQVVQQLVGQLGEYIAGHVVCELENVVRPEDEASYRLSLTKHFWCDLLAATACSMSALREKAYAAPGRIVTAVMRSRSLDERPAVREYLVRAATDLTVEGISHLPGVRTFDDALMTVRILAVFVCPAPERHQAVVTCCIEPMGKQVISEEIQRRLTEAMPPGWMGQAALAS